MKQKKSQISQIFIYIMALLIFALILYYGYYSISSFIKKGEEVVYIKFKTEFENEVDAILPQFGSVSIFNKNNPLKAPGRTEEVCFVSYDLIGKSESELPSNLNRYPIIKLSVQDGVQENIFLLPREERTPISFLRIKVDGGFECIKTKQGRLDIKLESFGSYVKIDEYTE